MRWKLLILAPLLATLGGAGLAFALVRLFSDHPGRFLNPNLFTWAAIAWTLAVIILASVSVYRRTSRRRRLQAALTAAFATLLSSAVLTLASL
jgi:branched-subunit amino acid ABC-type transport system permease component